MWKPFQLSSGSAKYFAWACVDYLNNTSNSMQCMDGLFLCIAAYKNRYVFQFEMEELKIISGRPERH